MGNTNSEDKNQGLENVKVVAVGYGTLDSPKDYWLHTYTIGEKAQSLYPRPGALPDYSTIVDYKGKQVKISLHDTNATEDYTQYRIETYHKADVVLLLFSRKEAVTFTYMKEKLLPEITYHLPAVPIILIDMENKNEAKTPVPEEELQALKKKDKRFVLFSHEIVPYDQECIRRVIEVTALEAVEFTRNLPFKTFEDDVYEKYHAELKKLKEKYDEAKKKSTEKAASAKEKLDELQKQINSEIREKVLACKWDLYAEKFGWK